MTFNFILALIGGTIALAIVLLGVGTIMELRGKRQARKSGCGPNGWRYLFFNDSEQRNSKVAEMAKGILEKGHYVIPSDLTVDVEIEECEGAIVKVRVVETEVEEEDAD